MFPFYLNMSENHDIIALDFYHPLLIDTLCKSCFSFFASLALHHHPLRWWLSSFIVNVENVHHFVIVCHKGVLQTLISCSICSVEPKCCHISVFIASHILWFPSQLPLHSLYCSAFLTCSPYGIGAVQGCCLQNHLPIPLLPWNAGGTHHWWH